MFARGLCKFWICTLLTPLHWVCSCWALLMFYSCTSYNWELNGSILNLHELKKGLINLLFGFQTAWEFSLFRWKCDKTITFLLLIITAFAVKKTRVLSWQVTSGWQENVTFIITVTALTQHLEDVSQLCTFVSDYYKRDSSGNDFLFRVSATGSSRDVSWIHTYRTGQIPGWHFSKASIRVRNMKSKDYIGNKWLGVLLWLIGPKSPLKLIFSAWNDVDWDYH